MSIPLKSKRILGSDTISVSPSGSVAVNAVMTAPVGLNHRGSGTKHLELIFEGPFLKDGDTKTKRLQRTVDFDDVPALVERIDALITYCNLNRANITNREEITVDLVDGITAGAVLYENTVFQDYLNVEDKVFGTAHLRLTGGNNLSRFLKICAALKQA